MWECENTEGTSYTINLSATTYTAVVFHHYQRQPRHQDLQQQLKYHQQDSSSKINCFTTNQNPPIAALERSFFDVGLFKLSPPAHGHTHLPTRPQLRVHHLLSPPACATPRGTDTAKLYLILTNSPLNCR